MKTVSLRLITDDERRFAETFQQVTKMCLDVFKDSKGRGAELQDYKNLKKNLKRFSNYPFMPVLYKQMADWDKELIDIFQSKRHSSKKIENIKTAADTLTKLFASGNIEQAYQYSKIAAQAVNAIEKRGVNTNDFIKNKRNPLYIENPLFFGRTGLLTQFEKSDMERIVEKNLDEFCWTYMPLPESKVNNYEFIAHWITQLKNSPDKVELSKYDFEKYSEFAYSSDEFDELKKAVTTYLKSNNKKLIPAILSMLENLPDLYQINEDQKKTISVVYRGLALDDYPDEDDIIETEQTNGFVATSTSKSVAKRFSYRIGHLESKQARRSDYGAVITYDVTPDAILLDTAVFGGLFGEDEIIIDVNKATVKHIEINEK